MSEGMECGCDSYCDWTEGERISPCNRQDRTARKQYTCDECGEIIAKGDRYEIVTGKCEGDWITHRTCRVCLNIRKDYGCGIVLGVLQEVVGGCTGVNYVTGEEMEKYDE